MDSGICWWRFQSHTRRSGLGHARGYFQPEKHFPAIHSTMSFSNVYEILVLIHINKIILVLIIPSMCTGKLFSSKYINRGHPKWNKTRCTVTGKWQWRGQKGATPHGETRVSFFYLQPHFSPLQKQSLYFQAFTSFVLFSFQSRMLSMIPIFTQLSKSHSSFKLQFKCHLFFEALLRAPPRQISLLSSVPSVLCSSWYQFFHLGLVNTYISFFTTRD